MLAGQISDIIAEIDTERPLDLTFYQVVPITLHETFFFEVIKTLARDTFSSNLHLLNRFKHGLYQILAIEQNTKWAKDFNDQMLSLYEKLGAGTSLAPNAVDDKPVRKYKGCTALSPIENAIMSTIECEESNFDFANIIRNKRKEEAERQF